MSTHLSDKDLAGLNTLLEKMLSVALDNDWDSYLEKLTDDVIFLPPDQIAVEGKEAARKWFASFPKIQAFDSKIVQADGRDDFAWAWGSYSMTVEPAPGKPMSLKGKWTATYRKQTVGSWLMASDIWNLDEPMKAI